MFEVIIRRAVEADIDNIIDLFRNTILKINNKDYPHEQVLAWTQGSERKKKWIKKINEQYFLVCQMNNEIVGFTSITREGYLDFLFVAHNQQGKGIASELYIVLENYARNLHLPQITSNVSITAKPFFEKKGFTIVQEQEVMINGVLLRNFSMKKSMASS